MIVLKSIVLARKIINVVENTKSLYNPIDDSGRVDATTLYALSDLARQCACAELMDDFGKHHIFMLHVTTNTYNSPGFVELQREFHLSNGLYEGGMSLSMIAFYAQAIAIKHKTSLSNFDFQESEYLDPDWEFLHPVLDHYYE